SETEPRNCSVKRRSKSSRTASDANLRPPLYRRANRGLRLELVVTVVHSSILPVPSGVAIILEAPHRKASKSSLSSRTEVGSFLVSVCQPAHLGKTVLCPIPNLRRHATDFRALLS